ncbi:cadherin 24, type 2b isoform X1 [Siphateles boraxobius]|uniref:cadherin 24, type 2b isoform X1 n=1 Tax=Siphateles boraxobius TaxID=180520 RepID=UPI004063E3BB
MIDRRLLLLVSLCFVGGACVSKIVRRRGVSSIQTQYTGNGATDQWDASLERNGNTMTRLKELIAPEEIEEQITTHQSHGASPVFTKENFVGFNAKPPVQIDSGQVDFKVQAPIDESRDILELKRSRNNTRKGGRVEKGIPKHHRTTSGMHFNRTRFKIPSRSRMSSNFAIHTTAGTKIVTPDSPRKLNLTGSLLKLISKENLVRIVNSQLKSVPGLNILGKMSHSRKRDLINMDHSQMEALKLKKQERTGTPELSNVDNQTAELHSSTFTNASLNSDQTVHTLIKQFSGFDMDLGEEDRKMEVRGVPVTASWKYKHFMTHIASTPQSEIMPSTETNPFTGQRDMGISNTPSQIDSGLRPDIFSSLTERSPDVEEESDQKTLLPFSVTQNPLIKTSEPIDSSHILKLPPDPEWVRKEVEESGEMTVDSRLGRGGQGLVFQEMDEDEDEGRNQQKGEIARSRRRRSWIWNQFFVIEEYAGPEPVLIGRLHTDMDRGDGRTKYVLRGEGAGSVFVIDEKTGNIHVTKPLDREEKDEYRLIATATDSQTERALEPSSQFIIRVQDINDNPPVFEDGPYSATVPEMANIGTSIIQVTASDADDPTYGNSARLVYTLVQGQPHFSMDPQTGILRTAVPDLDREAQDLYLVVLQAKDMGGHLGGLSGTTTITVRLTDVNDNPPRFVQSSWLFSVSELAVPGAEVGRISATDADLGDNAKLEYTILDGESGDTFNITGANQEAVIILNKAVDYESRSSYSFSVEVLNPIVDPRFLRRGPFKDRASIRVAVLDADEPPRFSRARYRMDVSENCPAACTVGRISAVDPDTGLTNNIRFSIDPQSDPEALFRITPDTGLITTVTELDREHEQWHNITIIATQRDNPSQVSRVVVSIETLDLNDNAPELDRQYNTAMCDSASTGQVVQVLRAIDRDEGGNDSTVHFNIPPDSNAALNFSVRESGGPTASLVLASPLQTLSRSTSSSLTLYVPLVLRDGVSGLTSTGTVTVSVCPCLRGGARAGEKEKQSEAEWDRETVCLPQHSSLPSPGLSTAALLAILACVATLLAVSALSLSLRRQKRDSLSPLEEDDVRENIITYDDEGGGEADTAAFDITALQSAPHNARRGYRTLDSRNIRYSQHCQEKARAYSSWAQAGAIDPGQYTSQGAPLYGRICYSSHTLPVLRRSQGPYEPGLSELAYRFPGNQPDHSLVIQNQAAMVGPLEPGAIYVPASEAGHDSKEGTASQHGATTSEGGTPRKNDSKDDASSDAQQSQSQSQDLDWKNKLILTSRSNPPAPPRPIQVQPDTAPRERELVLTRSGSVAGPGTTGGWMCDSSTLPRAGRHSSRGSLSLSRSGAGPAESNHPGVVDVANGSAEMQSVSGNYATILQGEQQRDYSGTLRRGGLEMGSGFVVGRPEREASIPLSNGMYPEGGGFIGDWHERMGINGYPLGRRDMTPQLLPYPGQGRGAFGGILGYGGAWPSAPEASGRGAPIGGAHSLALRVGEFLRLRLAQVTFDPSQPPYDSVQVYGLEGTGSRAGSLSSLDSEGSKDAEKEVWGAGLEDWGPQFQKLAQLFRERERENEEDKERDVEAHKKHKDREWKENEEQSGDEEQANV